MVAVPFAVHVAGVVLTVGTAGVTNIHPTVKLAEAVLVHVPDVAVTVYGVPQVIPFIAPPETEGPAGVKV